MIVSALCVVFGLWWLAGERPRSLSTMGFVLLPWLTFMAFETFSQRGCHVQSLVNLGMWMQAAALMAIVATVGRSRTFVFKLIAALFLFAFLCAFSGIRQFGISPGWVPGGFVQATWATGAASGPFIKPSSLAAFMVLVLPLAYGMAAARAFSIETKIACWVLTVIFTGCLFITANVPAIAIGLVTFLAMPFMHSKNRARNFRDMFIGLALVALTVILVGLTDHESRSRVANIFRMHDPAPQSFMNETALASFKSNLVSGAGDDYLALQMKGVMPASDNTDTGDYNGQFLQSLATSGLFSILLFAPLFLCILWGWKKWYLLPYDKISQEEAFRSMPHDIGGKTGTADSSTSASRHRHHHRSSHSDSHPMPTTKVLLGGFLVGLCGFSAMMLVSSPLRNEALVFLMAVAMAAIICLGRLHRIEISHSIAGIAGFGIATIWAGMTISVSLTSAYSQMHVYKANARMDSLNETTSSIQAILRAHFDSLKDTEAALTLEPRNADASAYAAKIEFAIAKYLPSHGAATNREVLSTLDADISSNPDNWYYESIRAEALFANFNDVAKADEAYDRLAAVGRNSPRALSLGAMYFARREGQEEKAYQLSEAALKMIPDFEAAKNVKSTISLKTNL